MEEANIQTGNIEDRKIFRQKVFDWEVTPETTQSLENCCKMDRLPKKIIFSEKIKEYWKISKL